MRRFRFDRLCGWSVEFTVPGRPAVQSREGRRLAPNRGQTHCLYSTTRGRGAGSTVGDGGGWRVLDRRLPRTPLQQTVGDGLMPALIWVQHPSRDLAAEVAHGRQAWTLHLLRLLGPHKRGVICRVAVSGERIKDSADVLSTVPTSNPRVDSSDTLPSCECRRRRRRPAQPERSRT
jgi:hypothetical protein